MPTHPRDIDKKALVDEAFTIGMAQIPVEIADLVEFVDRLSPRHIMEIGSDQGGTFWLWCRLATGLKISVDLPLGPYCTMHMTFEDTERVACRMRSWSEDAHVLRGNSHDLAMVQKVYGILGGEKLDFLFVDGDHSYEGVKKDYRLYRTFVRSGGWIAFHDTNESYFHEEHGCGVHSFWKEIEGHKIDISSHQDWGGIGLLQVE